jgi:hypothetical protein
MKKLLMSSIIILLLSMPVFAQVEVDWEATGGMFYNFENDSSTWTAFSCGADDGQAFFIEGNPDKSGIDLSDSVGLYITTDACTWEGCYTDTKFKPIDFATYPIIKAKVYAPAAGMQFMVKIEDYGNNTNFPIEVQATTTKASEWEELSFDFSAAPATGVDYGRVVIFSDFGFTGIDYWYFDDIRLDGVPAPSAVQQQPKQASSFLVASNYPNPFNPQTVIEYTLPISAPVKLTVFDATGKQVSVLVSENQSAGTYTVPFDGSSLASGVYFYRLAAGHNVVTQKMLLTK